MLNKKLIIAMLSLFILLAGSAYISGSGLLGPGEYCDNSSQCSEDAPRCLYNTCLSWPGTSCDSHAECAGDETSLMICEYGECCGRHSYPCSSDNDCCSDFYCSLDKGYCVKKQPIASQCVCGTEYDFYEDYDEPVASGSCSNPSCGTAENCEISCSSNLECFNDRCSVSSYFMWPNREFSDQLCYTFSADTTQDMMCDIEMDTSCFGVLEGLQDQEKVKLLINNNQIAISQDPYCNAMAPPECAQDGPATTYLNDVVIPVQAGINSLNLQAVRDSVNIRYFHMSCEPYLFCGDGKVNMSEECENPDTNDNNFCSQSTESCLGNKLGTRDSLGNCDADCGCVYDPFNYQCVKDRCGAECAVDSDCDDQNPHTSDSCNIETCGCEYENVPYCGDGYINQQGEECDLGADNGLVCEPPYEGSCSYCSEECINITLTDGYCGDGIVQEGYEECDNNSRVCEDQLGYSGIQDCAADCTWGPCESDEYCGDGFIDDNEECEGPGTDDNNYCGQSELNGCNGYKLGTRDAYGYCTNVCSCLPDEFVFVCVAGSCGAECGSDSECPDKCIGDIYYYDGSCDLCNTCSCSWDSIDCDDSDGWYDNGNTQWVSTGLCDEKEQKEQEYRDYYCTLQGCDFSVTDSRWVDTGDTQYKPDGTVCNDGQWCTTPDVCTQGVCGGPVRDCSQNNLPTIGECSHNPDNYVYTWDMAPGFESVCDEVNDRCTTGSYSFTHICADNDLSDSVPYGGCNAECDEQVDCPSYCSDNVFFNSLGCDLTSCYCSYSEQVNCSDMDYYDEWEYFCEQDSLKKKRLYHYFVCDPVQGCREETEWRDETVVEDCYYEQTSCEGNQIWGERGFCNASTLSCDVDDGMIEDCYYYTENCDGTSRYSEEGYCEPQNVVCKNTTQNIFDCADNNYDECYEVYQTHHYTETCQDNGDTTECVEDQNIFLDCRDDSWCNGQEVCTEDGGVQCVAGTPPDCSLNSYCEIGGCDYIPDDYDFTWDASPGFTSECIDEGGNTGYCTEENRTWNHTCADNDLSDSVPLGGCNAECDEDSDCGDQDVHTIDICNFDTCTCEHEQMPYCGDGILNTSLGEQCEPANTSYCNEECQWIELTCVEAKDAGLIVGKDVSIFGAQATVYNYLPADYPYSYDVGLAVYEKFNENISQQEIFDWDTAVSNPDTNTTLGVELPECKYQIDLFCGEVLQSLDCAEADPCRYGNRKIDWEHSYHGYDRYCGPYCGDGEVNQPEEQCDDGNNINGDGCSAECVVEESFCVDEILDIDYAQLDKWCGGDNKDVTWRVNVSDDVVAYQGACSQVLPNYIYLDWYNVSLADELENASVWLEHQDFNISLWLEYRNGSEWVKVCDLPESSTERVDNCLLNLNTDLEDIKLRLAFVRNTICHEELDWAYIKLTYCYYPEEETVIQTRSAPVVQSSGGGGGGGSGSYDDSEDWDCSDCTECVDGEQECTCYHKTRTGVSKQETQECIPLIDDKDNSSNSSEKGSAGGSNSGSVSLSINSEQEKGSEVKTKSFKMPEPEPESSGMNSITGMMLSKATPDNNKNSILSGFSINWYAVSILLMIVVCLPLFFYFIMKK